VPSPTYPSFAAPLATTTVLAHADGFNWDEALMVLAPIAIIAAVLLYVNRKLSAGLDDPANGPVDPTDPGGGSGSGAAVDAADAPRTPSSD
jgi:hypothetical protein